MLITPFGNIDIQFDGLTARYDQIAIKPPKQRENVDACHLLNFYYHADGKPHVLERKIEGTFKDTFQ